MWNYQREHVSTLRNENGTFTELSNEPIEERRRRRGAPVKLESLQLHFAWTVQNKILGDSYGQIAENYKVIKSSVVGGIDFVMAHLPDLEMVPEGFHDLVSRLRGQEKPENQTESN
jgi:hypothetical protein